MDSNIYADIAQYWATAVCLSLLLLLFFLLLPPLLLRLRVLCLPLMFLLLLLVPLLLFPLLPLLLRAPCHDHRCPRFSAGLPRRSPMSGLVSCQSDDPAEASLDKF